MAGPVSLGVLEAGVHQYDVALIKDTNVLIVRGIPEEAEKARDIFPELNRTITRVMARQFSHSTRQGLCWIPKGTLELALSGRATGDLQVTTQPKYNSRGDLMLVKAKALKGYSLRGLDGDIGSASEFFFDDRYWAVRYLVANTAGWLSDRKVLISPYSLSDVDSADEKVSVQLTRKEIEDSPSTETDEPVSHQFENSYNSYYGYPEYWGGSYMWGGYPYIVRNRAGRGSSASEAMKWDRHLRSTHEVTGYHLLALDGETGHVDDFIVDDETWAIRYLVVATKNWWPGKKVLISPKWIESVSWDAREVAIGLTRDTIKAAPAYTDESLLTRDYETGLHGHYNRKGYWVEELSAV